MMGSQTPVLLLKEGTRRDKGHSAQSNNIGAARAVADAVRTTLGPKGMDKMLVDSMGDVVITNDGVTILKEIDVEHPAAKMIVEVAKTQDEECGDGTTTAVILAGDLLKRSEELIDQNIHPTVITSGFKMAAEHAVESLRKLSTKVKPNDKEVLMNIARTAMTGKSAEVVKDHLAELAVKAVMAVAVKENGDFVVDKDDIQIEKKTGGTLLDTALLEGIILDKERVSSGMPRFVKGAKVALLNAALEFKKTEVDANIKITDPEQLQAFLAEEEKMIKRMVDQVIKSGASVLVCQKGIDDLAQHYLSKAGIYAVRRAKKSDMEKLAKATGATIVINWKELGKEHLGKAGLVEERKIANDQMTFVSECPNAKAVSILVRGGTEHVVDEIDRNLVDAVSVIAAVIEDGAYTIGGGAAAVELAEDLRRFGNDVGGREQMAIEAFAAALEIVPRTLAENAGLDPINALIDLRKAHKKGNKHHGLNVMNGEIEDMTKHHVFEPLRVGTQAITSATDAAIMILRIDDVIAAKKGSPMPPPGAGGMDGGMGGMPPGMPPM